MEKYKNLAYKILISLIILFGIYIRTKLYFVSNVFEDDECRLALSMFDKNIWQMFLPLGAFSSTPIFMFISKIIADVTNYNEYALKFLPFLFSILSLAVFYKICEEYFNRKFSVIISTYLFSVNMYVIYFSSIFKTYSLEIFTALLCLYYFPKINILKLNPKQTIIIAATVALLPLISLPSLFFIGIFFVVNIFENYKEKIFYKKFGLISGIFSIVFAIYYYFNLLPTKKLQWQIFTVFWHKVYSLSLLKSLAEILNFLFEPNNCLLLTLIIIICSTLYVAFAKKEHTKMNFYIYTVSILTLAANYLHLYPTAIGRTAVFAVPLLIIVLVKLTDSLSYKNILFYIVFFIFLICTLKYYMPSYLGRINDVVTQFRNFAPKTLLKDIAIKYNPETDYIVSPDASFYSLKYYSEINHFKDINIISIKLPSDTKKQVVWSYYNRLNPYYNHWFYLIKEYKYSNERKYILQWLEHQNILYKKKDRNSYLYYISGVKRVGE